MGNVSETETLFDFHVHCFPAHLARRAVDSVRSGSPKPLDGTLEAQLDLMRSKGIGGCALLHMASRPDTMRHVNEFALSTRGPGRFVFGSVHPAAPNALAELEWLYEQGIRGVKFHTGHQRFDFDDPANLPLYRRIGQLGMVTLVHCGPSARSPLHLVWPHTVARVITAFGGAPFICAHMGGASVEEPAFELLCQMPVLLDTALASRSMDGPRLAEAARRLGPGRLLFGSDLPWASYDAALELVEQAAAADVDFDRRAVLGGNARKLLEKMS